MQIVVDEEVVERSSELQLLSLFDKQMNLICIEFQHLENIKSTSRCPVGPPESESIMFAIPFELISCRINGISVHA